MTKIIAIANQKGGVGKTTTSVNLAASVGTKDGYSVLLNKLKKKVSISRCRAALSANKELVSVYHYIGNCILKSQEQYGWGTKIIHKLSHDLRLAFPEMKGFSPQNLKYMRRFAEEYAPSEIGQQAVDQLPWGHIVMLLYGISDKGDRAFYIKETLQNGWSRNMLSVQLETKLLKRQGKAVTNFKKKLVAPHSDLAQATLKNPYLFDFLNLEKDVREREVELALIKHVEKFLLELGEGFAFLGRQYHLQVEDQDFYLDLLFYHIKLRCFVVIDLTRIFHPSLLRKPGSPITEPQVGRDRMPKAAPKGRASRERASRNAALDLNFDQDSMYSYSPDQNPSSALPHQPSRLSCHESDEIFGLKAGKFKPEYTGKMNFYLSAVDDLLRQPGDNPSVGLILCRSKVGVLAEYALRDMTKPIGLAEYRITQSLPKNLKTTLPTIEELEAEFTRKIKN